ncbi:MAG: tetratricopeptide repeat protein [Deltaproteobacteria bacterium]
MNEEQRRYILEHRQSASAAQMARALGLKEKKVRRFLEGRAKGIPAAAGGAEVFVFDRRFRRALLLVVLLGLAVYADSLKGPYIWDDHSLIEENAYVGDWSRLGEVFTHDVGAGFHRASTFYRPLQIVSYMADRSLWGSRVFGWHLSNVAWHILAVVALYVFIGVCFGDRRLALVAGILFLVHPVHTEVASYISGRADAMALFFLLFAFVGYLRSADRPWGYLLMVVSYAAACLSKENGLILVPLVLVYHGALKRRFRPLPFCILVLLSAAYLWLRSCAVAAAAAEEPYTTTVGQRLPGFFAAVAGYLRILVWPAGLHMEYGLRVFPFLHPLVLAGLAIVLVSLGLVWVRRRAPSFAAFCVSWFFVALLPVGNIFPINAYMAEHWLYVPSIGFFLLLGKGFTVLGGREKTRRWALFGWGALVAVLSFLTFRQNRLWGDPEKFYEYTLRYAPNSTRVLNNLAVIYHEEGKLEKAIACHKKAIASVSASDPLHYTKVYVNYFNLGNIYRTLGRLPEAVAAYRDSIAIGPAYLPAYVNLGGVYQELGRPQDAEAVYRQAISRDPSYTLAYDNLGALYVKTNRWEDAIALCRQAQGIDPRNMNFYGYQAAALSALGRTQDAVKVLERAIEIDPRYVRGYQNLAKACFNIGAHDRAVRYYDKAMELGLKPEPDFLRSLAPFRGQGGG